MAALGGQVLNGRRKRGARLLVRRGVDIDYVGYAGPYALDADGDPGAARYLVRVFGTNNKPGAAARPVRYP